MGTDVDRAVERAGSLLGRLSPQAQRMAYRARKRRQEFFLQKLGRVALAAGAIILGAGAFGLFVGPLGGTGVMLAGGALILSTAGFLIWPQYPQANEETLVQTDLKLLPAQTEVWLAQQRRALPAPAANLLDGIGVRLETLSPQLQTLDPREPVAMEVRKILSEHLPELVNGYKRVPEPLRREVQSSGMTPDQQLADGLKLIDEEIATMTRNIAAGDLDKLATQEKFLQLKYRDTDGIDR